MPGVEVREKLLSWGSDVEYATLDQAAKAARLPIVEGHVALMPDAHVGIGSTVGSVIPTKGAVIPAAVGVDIGCFTGDTMVSLCDGTSRSLAELAANTESFAVWACREDGTIVAAYATCRLTRSSARLVEVVIDNGEVIRCTPDHEFMLRDGSFVRADQLARKTSLMPLYQSNKDGYTFIRQPASQDRLGAHQVVALSGLIGDRPENSFAVVHHLDGNPRNNDPSNLEWITQSEHLKRHHAEWANDSAMVAQRAEVAARNWRTYMDANPDFADGNGERGKSYLLQYNQSEAGRAKSREIASRRIKCPFCELVTGYAGLSSHLRHKHDHSGPYKHLVAENHKVILVRPIDAVAILYCIDWRY